MSRDPGPRFYCIRQARTSVVGSRVMTAEEAGREAACWRDDIGPAAVVPATPQVRTAIRRKDQTALTALLGGEWGQGKAGAK